MKTFTKALIIIGLIAITISSNAQSTKTIDVAQSGTLNSLLTTTDFNELSNLTLTGTIDARDFLIIRDSLKVLDSLNLTDVKVEAYSGIGGTTSYADSIEYLADAIPYKAFYSDTLLKDLKLPSSITSIDALAFYSCVSLKSISIPSKVLSIGEEAFDYCDSIESISIPASVTYLGNYAFYHCNNLKSVVLDAQISQINKGTFYECSLLNNITLPQTITSIGEYAFGYCYDLKSINIPSLVDSILPSAFYDCIGLESISLPSSVTFLGSSAFTYCHALQSVVLSNSLKVLENSVFNYCDKLSAITIPSSVTSIGSEAFYSCDSLKEVIIPSKVTSIGEGAFSYCKTLKTVTIPSSVTSIGYDAFSSCESLKTVTIPSSVKTLGSGAFRYCYSLVSLNLPSSLSTINDFTFYKCSNLKSITIPASIDSIGESAFEACDSLQSVYLPSSITFIGKYSFYNCAGLNTINIPNSVDSIGYNAFQYDTLVSLRAFTGPNIVDYDKLTGDTLYIPVGTKAAYISSGRYNFKNIVEFDACVASANLITIPGQGIMPAIYLKSDTTVCPNQTVTLKVPKAVSYLWSTKDTTQSITATTGGTYSVTVTGEKGCTNSAKEQVIIHQPFAEQIKVATYNSKGTAVVVAWSPTKGQQIGRYALQRLDDASGKYKTVAIRGLTDSTYYVDYSANTAIQSYLYKLITYETMCNDSAVSDIHETIHLACSQSTNASTEVQLSWNNYRGLIPDTYIINVYDGTSKVDEFSNGYTGNQTYSRTYTKHKAGYTYQIGFNLAKEIFVGTLKSDSGPFSQSLSNLAESQLTDVDVTVESDITIYPNPAKSEFTISVNEPASVSIYSLSNQLVVIKSISGTDNVELQNIAAGIYIVKIKTNNSVVVKRIVVE